jgi:hypothetical protein
MRRLSFWLRSIAGSGGLKIYLYPNKPRNTIVVAIIYLTHPVLLLTFDP